MAFALAIMAPIVMPAGTAPPSLPLAEILRQMDEHDHAMSDSLIRYTCERRYTLQNKRFKKKAEIRVRMTYSSPGHKTFEVLSEQGPSVIRQRVLRPMLAAEEQASQDDIRPHTRIVLKNYNFKLLGSAIQEERPAYLLDLAPKSRNKFLISGRVWVDSQNFGVMRVEAVPAQNPSVFIHNTQIVQQSIRFDDLWLPSFIHSRTDSFLFGRTEVSIDSWDYRITRKPPSAPVL
ncbi:MAG: hypothetical protein M3Z09_07055 [Acidobacteriota bacterium]|nr:hypothetical protein [Acidobacteriota bacterium]